jgi:hypothetical protein
MQHIGRLLDNDTDSNYGGFDARKDMVMQSISEDPSDFMDFLNGDEHAIMAHLVSMIYDPRCQAEQIHAYLQTSLEGALDAFVELRAEEPYEE